MMTRLLHLIDDHHPAAMAMLPSLISAWHQADHRVVVLGHGSLQQELASMGLTVDCHSSATSLWRAASLANDRIIVAWSLRCARAARIMLHQNPCVWVAMEKPDVLTRRLLRGRGCLALCVNETIQQSLACVGIKSVTVAPPFASGLIGTPTPSNGQTEKQAFTIVLLADDPREVDALGGAMAVSLVAEALRDQPDAATLKLRVHPHARHQTRGRKFLEAVHGPHRLVADTHMNRPWKMLHPYDLVVLWGHETQAAAGWAAAAGVRVIKAGHQDPKQVADQLHSHINSPSTGPKTVVDAPCDPSDWKMALEEYLTACPVTP